MGPVGCPETLVRNYYYPLLENPEERSSSRVKNLKMGAIGSRVKNPTGFLTLEDDTDRLSRNVGKKSPVLAAQ